MHGISPVGEPVILDLPGDDSIANRPGPRVRFVAPPWPWLPHGWPPQVAASAAARIAADHFLLKWALNGHSMWPPCLRAVLACTFAAVVGVTPATVRAQDYPTRPIRLV